MLLKPICLFCYAEGFANTNFLQHRTEALFTPAQEDFVEVTHDYPDAWHSMDLVAEHRLRMLRTSNAYAKWQAMHKSQPNTSSKLSIKIEQVLEVGNSHQECLDGPPAGYCPRQLCQGCLC